MRREIINWTVVASESEVGMPEATEPDQDRPAQTSRGPATVIDSVTHVVDDLVPAADSVANAVLRDDSPYMRRAGTLFAVCAVVLLPWIVVLAVTLPYRQLSPQYAIAWSGFDVMEFVALAATCLWLSHRTHVVDERRLALLLRRPRARTATAASNSAAHLVVGPPR
jgi:hypothetical protein